MDTEGATDGPGDDGGIPGAESRVFAASARELTQESQSRMMPSFSYLGWALVVVLVGLSLGSREPGVVAVTVVLALVMTAWEVRNHRRRHRWDHLEERAAAEPTPPPPTLRDRTPGDSAG